jgi:hypothetical protein
MQILHISRISTNSCLFNLQNINDVPLSAMFTTAANQNLNDGHTTKHKNKLDGNSGNQITAVQIME